MTQPLGLQGSSHHHSQEDSECPWRCPDPGLQLGWLYRPTPLFLSGSCGATVGMWERDLIREVVCCSSESVTWGQAPWPRWGLWGSLTGTGRGLPGSSVHLPAFGTLLSYRGPPGSLLPSASTLEAYSRLPCALVGPLFSHSPLTRVSCRALRVLSCVDVCRRVCD